MALSPYLAGRLAFRRNQNGISCPETEVDRWMEWWKGWKQEKVWTSRMLHHNQKLDVGSLHLVARALLESVELDAMHPERTLVTRTAEAFHRARMLISGTPIVTGPSGFMSLFVELPDGTRLTRHLGS